MFNVDRWGVYSAQRLGIPLRRLIFLDRNWPNMTSKQFRRCVKKARKRNDWSIGLYAGDGYDRSSYRG